MENEKIIIQNFFEKDSNGKLLLDEKDHLPILNAEGRKKIYLFLKRKVEEKSTAEKMNNETPNNN